MSCFPFSSASNPYTPIVDVQLGNALDIWIEEHPLPSSTASSTEIKRFTKKFIQSLKKLPYKDCEIESVIDYVASMIKNGGPFTSFFIKNRLARLIEPHFWQACIGDRSQIERLQRIYQAIFWVFPKTLEQEQTEQTFPTNTFSDEYSMTQVQDWLFQFKIPPYQLHVEELEWCIRKIVAPLKTIPINEETQPLIVKNLSTIARISELHKSMLDGALSEIINPRSYPNSSIVSELPLTKIRYEVAKTIPQPWRPYPSAQPQQDIELSSLPSKVSD